MGRLLRFLVFRVLLRAVGARGAILLAALGLMRGRSRFRPDDAQRDETAGDRSARR